MEITIKSLRAQALAAATETTVFDGYLAGYEKVTVAIENPGAEDITAVKWNEGAGDILADNTVVAAAVLDSLDAGEKSVTVLTGSDIPSRLQIKLTSTNGTTYHLVVKGESKAADLFPGC